MRVESSTQSVWAGLESGDFAVGMGVGGLIESGSILLTAQGCRQAENNSFKNRRIFYPASSRAGEFCVCIGAHHSENEQLPFLELEICAYIQACGRKN